MEKITSVNNEKVKHAASLNDKKFRRASKTFLVEGYKLVKEIVDGAGELVSVYVEESFAEKYSELLNRCDVVYVLTKSAFNKISDTISSQGIIAEVKMKDAPKLSFSEPFIALDGISDPGNLGTIIRTAAAVGFNNIVLLNCVDPYSPKVVRSSSGGIFHTNFYALSYDEFEENLKTHGVKLYIADMKGENIFKVKKLDPLYSLVIGSEGNGVSTRLKNLASRVLSIPMKSEMESLNAGVSASLIMYQLKNIEGAFI